MVVILAGLPGTGKSTLARALAERVNGTVVDKDTIRAALFQPAFVEYSVAQDDFCLEVMLQTAAFLLRKDHCLHVFLDGRTFSQRYQWQRAIECSERLGSAWALVECGCLERTALARLEQAAAQGAHPAANRTPELYRRLRLAWEPIDCPKISIDTDAALDSCAALALRYLQERSRVL